MGTANGVFNKSSKGEWDASWLGGAVLMAVGTILLLQNLENFSFDNRWALLITIPGVAALATAWHSYQRNGGRLDGRVGGAVMGSLLSLLVAAVFLLGLDWGVVWPGFLILAGLAGLLSSAVKGREAAI